MGFPDSVGGFEAAHVAWEGLIEKWESASGNFLDEQVKVTVVMQKAPMTIRGFLQIQGITSYIRLREILVAYFLSQSTIADPMAGLVSGAGHQLGVVCHLALVLGLAFLALALWLGQGIDLHRLVSSTTHQSCHRIRDGRLGQEIGHKNLSQSNVRRDPLDLKEASDRHRRLLHDFLDEQVK